MKIDKRDCPILFDKLSFNRLGLKQYSGTGNKITPELIASNENILKPCFENIMYITHDVVRAFDYGDQNTIIKLMSLRNEIQSVSRCVIWKEGGACCTTLYTLEKQDERTVFSMLWQMTSKKYQFPINFHISGYWDHDWMYDKFGIGGVCSLNFSKEDASKSFITQAELIVQCEVFLQYAKLETKYLKHNEKDSILCRYENKLPFPITIVDSTWYTNLIKSDAFKVRGHFRLQPHGESRKDRKLIWINEFQKEGYTREAKMLTYSNGNIQTESIAL